MHAFKKDNTNKEDYFPNSYSSLGSRGWPEPIPAAQAQGGNPSCTGYHVLTCAFSHARSGWEAWDTPAPSPAHVWDLRGNWNPPEKTCGYWGKTKTLRKQVPQVGVDFLFPSHQLYHVTTVKETMLSRDLLYWSWSEVPSVPANILNLVSPLTFLKPNSSSVK